MALAAHCEQPLSTRYSRWLITYEKTAEYDAAAASAWRDGRRGFKMGIECVADLVWESRPARDARAAARALGAGVAGAGGGEEGEGGAAALNPKPRRQKGGAGGVQERRQEQEEVVREMAGARIG
jgi:hypothetical protein